jgi:hypothetical protein
MRRSAFGRCGTKEEVEEIMERLANGRKIRND